MSTKRSSTRQSNSSENQEKAILNAKGEEEYIAKLQSGIVPDVIDADGINNDVLGLVVKYPSSMTLLGNELTPQEAKQQPLVEWKSDPEKFYTLSMTDPDAPSRADPKFREWQHWLVVNIPGNQVAKGDSLADYVGPGPPKGTGLHRYVFLLFEQPSGKINFSEPYKSATEMGSRKNFHTKDFVKKYQLGKVVAANYFKAQTK